MKDNDLALALLARAKKALRNAERNQRLMQSQPLFSPSAVGLAYAVQRELAHARMLAGAARSLHPFTRVAAKGSARPVPPKARPAACDVRYSNTLNFGGVTTEHLMRLQAEWHRAHESRH